MWLQQVQKNFQSFFTLQGRLDFSSYNRHLWPSRELEEHGILNYKYLNASTKSDQKVIESEHGVRFSALVDLAYFDPKRFAAIDPMHNLFLGTAKRLITYYTEQEILSE